jgi:hypothetical protein
MYINNFSSGTILALLALSGMLFLVPLAAPVHATNANPVALKVTTGSPVLGATSGLVSIQITNPATNAYAVTAFTLTAPSGWAVTACNVAIGTHYFENCVSSGTGATYYTALNTGNTPLSPGASDTVGITLTPATGFYPFSGTFTSTVQDASSASFYGGPSFSVQVIDPTSFLSVITVTPGGANSVSQYTAGTAPYTDTVEVGCTTTTAFCPTGYESGVPVNFKIIDAQNGNAATVTPSSTATGATGTVTVTVQPSDKTATPLTNVYAVIGTDVFTNTSINSITTIAGAPAKLTFTPSYTNYINTGITIGSTTYADIAAFDSPLTYSVADQFGNPIGIAGLHGFTITTASLSATTGFFSGIPGTTTYAVTNGNYGIVPEYSQSATYGTLGLISGTISGTYTPTGGSFSVSGASSNIYTSTFTNALSVTEAHPVNAHVTAQAGSTTPITVLVNAIVSGAPYHQAGVPVTLALCVHTSCGLTTKGYIGTFSGSSTFSGITNSTGYVSGAFKVATTAGFVGYFNATVSTPMNQLPKAVQVFVLPFNVTTIAGPASAFNVKVGFGTTLTPGTIYATPGETLYVNVIQSDAYGNIVETGANQQTQITLVPSAGFVTATAIYIPTGCYETNGTSSAAVGLTPAVSNGCAVGFNGFGPIAWTVPSTLGPVSITASGVLLGKQITSPKYTVTVVSATPSISVTSPHPLNGFIYTNNQAVVFSGQANVSLGFPGTAHIKSIGYKIGTNAWQTASVAQLFNATWSVALTLPVGLSTVTFNATDSNSPANTVVSSPYTVLVDTTTPTITFVTSSGATVNSTTPFTARIVDSEGDLNATSVVLDYNGTALPSSDITVTGTNNPGSNVTYTVTATLPGGHWTVELTGKNLAGTSIASQTLTVFQALTPTSSFVLVGSVVKATVGGNPDGITGTYFNNLQGTQTITVIGTATNAAGQQVAAATATITVNSLGQQTFSMSFLGLTPGQTYTINFYAVSSAGVAGSVLSTTTLTA